MTIREIEPQEWERLAPVYEANGDRLPSFEANRVIIAEVNGEIVGMCGLNAIVHVGPLWVSEEFRGRGVAGAMTAKAGSLVAECGGAGYFMFPSTPESVKVVEKMGLIERAWKVFERTLYCLLVEL